MVCMMIVPDVLKPAAVHAAKQLDPTSTEYAFTVPLRTIGSESITHWYCGPNLIDQPAIDAIRNLVNHPQFTGAIYRECPPDNIPVEINQLLTEHNLERVVS